MSALALVGRVPTKERSDSVGRTHDATRYSRTSAPPIRYRRRSYGRGRRGRRAAVPPRATRCERREGVGGQEARARVGALQIGLDPALNARGRRPPRAPGGRARARCSSVAGLAKAMRARFAASCSLATSSSARARIRAFRGRSSRPSRASRRRGRRRSRGGAIAIARSRSRRGASSIVRTKMATALLRGLVVELRGRVA